MSNSLIYFIFPSVRRGNGVSAGIKRDGPAGSNPRYAQMATKFKSSAEEFKVATRAGR